MAIAIAGVAFWGGIGLVAMRSHSKSPSPAKATSAATTAATETEPGSDAAPVTLASSTPPPTRDAEPPEPKAAEAASAPTKAGSRTKTPRNLSELDAWYAELPAGENAAPGFLAAASALQVTPQETASADLPWLGKGHLPDPQQHLSPRALSQMGQIVRRNEAALNQAHAAARARGGRYPIRLADGGQARLPHALPLASLRRVLALAAVYHAERGELGRAADGIDDLMALARSLEAEPLLISQAWRHATLSAASEATERLLNRGEIPASTLERLQAGFAGAEAAEDEASDRCLVAERLNLEHLFSLKPEAIAGSLQQRGMGSPVAVDTDALRKNLAQDRGFSVETLTRLERLMKAPWPGRLDGDGYVEGRKKDATGKKLQVTALALLTPSTRTQAGAVARLRVSQTALALARHLQTSGGAAPETLNQLVPAQLVAPPLDPFTGHALRYVKTTTHCSVYSIGPDLRDDAGRRRSMTNTKADHDVVFTVPLHAAASPGSLPPH